MPDEIGVPSSNVAGYIRGLISEGVGPTEGLRIFKDEPFGHIRESRWFDLYREVNDTIAREPQWAGLDPFSTPAPGEYGTFEAGQGGKFVTTVEMQMIDRGTGLWFTQKAEYWTSEPHTPAEAEDWALSTWSDSDLEAQYSTTVMGALAVHLWQTTPLGLGG